MPHCLSTAFRFPILGSLHRRPLDHESQDGRYVPFACDVPPFYQNLNITGPALGTIECRTHPLTLPKAYQLASVSPNSRSTFLLLPFFSTCQQTLPRFRRPPRTSIHILDDISLLQIFSLYRPNGLERDQYDRFKWDIWDRERWWYKLVQVCQRWRRIILASPSHLGLCLLCTPGTPVADMLAHSPPFPLVIDYYHPNHDLTTEDEEGIMLALQHRNRVQRICLRL